MTEVTQADLVKAEIELLKAKIAKIEADAKVDFAKVKAWFGTNLPHFVTWAGGAALAVKLGALKLGL